MLDRLPDGLLVLSTVRSSTPAPLKKPLAVPHSACGVLSVRQFGMYSPGVTVTVFPLIAVTFKYCDCARPGRLAPPRDSFEHTPWVWHTQMVPVSVSASSS